MSFFLYTQNNSGGGFDFDETRGLTHYVIVEAASADEANERAREIGIYFNGCDSGQDCACCGDRWDEAGSYDEEDQPEIYGEPAHDFTGTTWMEPGKEVCVHYADGRKLWYGAQEKRKKA